jgi:phage tail tape-measure protein
VETVASEIIDAKLAKEKMYEISQMVDLRFGPGTWKSIVDERARRIQEAKEMAAAARRKKIQEAKEFEENLKQVVLVSTVVVMALGLVIFLVSILL